jgi:adsorption protein B
VEWLVLVEHELLLFAGVFFLLGAIDELAVDFAWLWLRLTGRARTPRLAEAQASELAGRAAVFIPAWGEAQVIGVTIAHALDAWPQADLRLYVGCYPNDPETMEAAIAAAGGDPRLRLVIVDHRGPSTKAACLNRLYRALREDERRVGSRARMILLHDAEDMVDPAALGLLDAQMDEAALVQLPVLPVAVPRSRWIASHYIEEFAESHGKSMVVRAALRAGLPSAGVGCAISRDSLDALAGLRDGGEPFAAECLTEDYELGLGIAELGGHQRFLRRRRADGELIATRACFPAALDAAVRQKTRWVHGIALQSWDRLGWTGRWSEKWMRLRDRRGPLTALVLAMGYLLLALLALGRMLELAGYRASAPLSPVVRWLLILNFASFIWRAGWRFGFTAREYGAVEGARAVLRIPLANVIAILAGRRALAAYLVTLAGGLPRWDKTSHDVHPASLRARGKRR